MKTNIQKKSAILLIIIFSTIVLNAQSLKHQRWKMWYSVGASNFMGDLGGGVGEGSHFMGYKDINLKASRYSYRFGVERKMTISLSFMQEFAFTKLYGDDALTKNPIRNSRNLHFKSIVWQTSTQMRYYFLREKEAGKHKFTGFGGMENLSAFVVFGGGIFYFNPRAKQGEEWNEIREEGVNYKKYAFSMPVGFGFKYLLDRDFSIGTELVNYYTTTDYIDDVHERGGEQFNDAYLLLLVSITYHIRK